jgi:glutathione synthase/RimK-type ligase-like ATP-grasp enzyme
MIVIISSPSDTHAATVLGELQAIGKPSILLDLSDFPINSQLAISCINKERTHCTWETPNGLIDFNQVRSIWWRRPQLFQVDPDLKDPDNAQFALSESYEAVTGLWQMLDAFWINVPSQDALAHRKPYQLRVAHDLGIPIPATLITNDPAAAQQFIACHEQVVCKAFSATETHWRETRLVKKEEMENLENVRFAPVIFQQYIEAIYDLRITVVGDDIFAAAIYSQETAYAVDCRIDIGKARIEAVSLPKQVEEQLRQYMKKLGLVYGAIDMRLHPDGTYVFLEINPAGQFLFIEDITGQAIAKSVAKNLVSAVS